MYIYMYTYVYVEREMLIKLLDTITNFIVLTEKSAMNDC